MSSAIEAGKAFVSLGVKSTMNKDLRKAKFTLQKFAKASATLMAGAAAASFGVATAAMVKLTNEAKEIRKLSGEIGVTTQEFQKLSYVSKQVGLDMDDMAGAIEEFRIRTAEAAQDGTGPLAEMFKKLGLDAKEFVNMPITEAIGKVSDELNKLDATSRQFAADEIFGGDGRRLMNVFKLGADGISEMSREAEEMGLVLSSETMQGLKSVSDGFRDLELAWDGMIGNMATSFADEMEFVVAFARIAMQDMAKVFELAGLSIKSSFADFIEGIISGVTGGLFESSDFANDLRKQMADIADEIGTATGEEMAKARERRKARDQAGNGGKGGKKGPKTNKIPGTTVPRMLTDWEIFQQKNGMGASIFSDTIGTGSPISKSLDISNSAIGGFVGGAGIGQAETRVVKVNEQQLEEQKKTNDKLDDLLKISNGGNPTIWGGGI